MRATPDAPGALQPFDIDEDWRVTRVKVGESLCSELLRAFSARVEAVAAPSLGILTPSPEQPYQVAAKTRVIRAADESTRV